MKKVLLLNGLCCANCAAKIERSVNILAGVDEATVNFLTCKMIIHGDEAQMPSIVSEAIKIVKKIEPKVVVVEK